MFGLQGVQAVRGEMSSAAASAGVAVSLFQGTTARTLASNETLTITDLLIVSVPGGNVVLAAVADSAGQRLIAGTFSANGGCLFSFKTPIVCPRGVTPVAFGPTGQLNVTLSGYITKE
jgi:hypothetical protein